LIYKKLEIEALGKVKGRGIVENEESQIYRIELNK